MKYIKQILEKQLLAVYVLLVFSQSVLCGRITYNRETTLGELRSIDGLVSSGLPVFNSGFFISTRNGPVLVKHQDASNTKPKINPRYYYTLPRVIPTGYEGIATSTFNLGSAFPVQQQSANFNRNIVETSHTYPQPQQSVINEQRALFPLTQNRFGSENVNLPDPQQSYSNIEQTHPIPVPSPQNSFQIDNGLSPGSDQQISALASPNYFGEGGSDKRATNEVVEQTIAFEESLPEEYRNPFYRNANLASTLAQESLPTQGEQVVYNWDTNKIQKGKIHALLRGAGFI